MFNKKGEIVTLIVVGLIFLVGSLFMSDSSITGAAITADVLDVDVPEDENLSVIDIIGKAVREEVKEVNLGVSSDLGVQAACNSWPCSCGDTITGSVTMTSNLSCSTNSLSITADNVVFDCDGFTLNSTRSSVFNAHRISLNSTSRDNVTIKNCNFIGDSAIYFSNTNNSVIQNNTVEDTIFGINLSESNFNLINDSNMSSFHPILLDVLSAYNNVTKNHIRGTDKFLSNLIRLSVSSNNTVLNNVLSNGTYGINVGHNAHGNNISFNNISNIWSYGIYENNDAPFILSASYPYVSNYSTYVSNNRIDNASSYGIYIENGTDRFYENNFINDTGYGMYFKEMSSDNIFIDNNFSNNIFHFYLHNSSSFVNNFTNNLFEGYDFYYYYANNNSQISGSNVGSVYIVKSENVSLVDFTTNISSNFFSVLLINSRNVTSDNITIKDSKYNLYLRGTNHSYFNNSLVFNDTTTNLYIENSINNTFSDFNFSNSTKALNFIVADSSYYDHNFSDSYVGSNLFSYLFNKTSQTISDVGGFFIVVSSNIVVDGGSVSGFDSNVINSSHINISGVSFTSSLTSIILSQTYNVTVSNVTVNNPTFVTGKTGISLTDANNTTIVNSNFYNVTSGVTASSSNNLTVKNNNFVDGSSAVSGANRIMYNNITNFSGTVLDPSDLAIIANNVILNSYCDSFPDSMISGDSFMTVLENSINNSLNNRGGDGEICTAISLSTEANLTNNNISNYDVGISINSNGNLSGNILFGNVKGITFSSSSYNILKNNLFYNSTRAVEMGASSENYFFNNTYYNNSFAFFIDNNNQNLDNNMTHEIFYNNSNAIYSPQLLIGNIVFNSPNGNNTFYDPIFDANDLDLNQSASSAIEDTTLVNATGFNQSKISVGSTRETYLKWYVDVNVSNATGDPIQNVNVSAFRSNGVLDYTNLTASNGIARLILSELYFRNSISYILTPHTITASKGDYTSNSTSLNMRNQTYALVNLSLDKVGCGDIITTDIQLGSNFSCSTDGLIIGADNVMIDGNGYYIFGALNGKGIISNGKNGLNISNLYVSNFSQGIYLNGSNDTFINESYILNGTHGVVFNDSNDGLILNSLVENNSANQIVLDTSFNYNNSLLNMSFDSTNSTVLNSGNLFKKWYVNINVTMNNTVPLQGANVTAYLNNSNTKETSKLTVSSGLAILDLKESKLNATGDFFITPHNITAFLNTSNDFSQNSTSFNLTLTNSTSATVPLVFDCTVPVTSSTIISDTTFCPGTYDVHSILIDDTGFLGAITLICDGTVLRHSSDVFDYFDGLKVVSQAFSTISIDGCGFIGYSTGNGIDIDSTNNFILGNISANSCGPSDIEAGGCIDIYNSDSGIIENFTLNSAPILLTGADSFQFYKGSVSNAGTGIYVGSTEQANITNVTFNSNTRALRIDDVGYGVSGNSTVYHNTFLDSGEYHLFGGSSIDNLNQSVDGGFVQGNAWDDFCNKGTDNDGDGYADTGSGSNYPYGESTSTKVTSSSIDYHPKIQTCVTEVLVGGSSSSASGSSTGGSVPPAAAVPVAARAPQAPTMSGDEAAAAIEIEVVEQREDEGNLVAVFEVKNNNPDKAMLLDPNLADQLENPKHAVPFLTTYPLRSASSDGVVGSSLCDEETGIGCEKKRSLLTGAVIAGPIDVISGSGISLTGDAVLGEALKSTLISTQSIVVPPGETLKFEVKVKPPKLSTKAKKLNVVLKSFGTEVANKEVEIEDPKVSAAAVDVNVELDIIDIYNLILAMPLSNGDDRDEYFFELSINKIHNRDGIWGKILPSQSTVFTEVYGPYSILQDNSLIFAHQLGYDSSLYQGKHRIVVTLYENNKDILSSDFDVDLN